MIRAPTSARTALRSLLPIALVLPVTIEVGLFVARADGLVGALPALVVRVVLLTGIFTAVVIWTARNLHRSELAAETANASLRRIADSGMVGVYFWSQDGKIFEANERFLGMLGYSRADLDRGTLGWRELTPPDQQSATDASLATVQRDGVVAPFEKDYLRKDGTRVRVLVAGATLASDHSRGITLVLDVSEQQRLNERLERTNEVLQEQNRKVREATRAKSDFLASMSHELRTPLNGIIGFAELMHDGKVGPVSDQHKEFLGDILTSARHLLQLINDVLDLSKVEAGKVELRPEAIDVKRVIDEVRDIQRAVAAGRGIALDVDVPESARQAVLDPRKLKQVLYNYVSNALKFSPKGSRVVIRVREQGADALRFEVEDAGRGISEADVKRLFVEFQQVGRNADTPEMPRGTGLGLALCRRLAEAQGGTVGVESVLGKGSTFWCRLPRRAGVASPPRETTPAGAPILVVEDDPKDRAWLVEVLERAGYATDIATTASEALSLASAHAYEAVLLDLLLPDASGWDVLRRLRETPRNAGATVIVVSVVSEKGIGRVYPVADFLEKPLRADQLLSALVRAGVKPGASTVLVVDDDPAALRVMETALAAGGYKAICRADAESGLTAARESAPSAIVLDLRMPGVDGFQFLERFRRDGGRAPVMVWTSMDLSAEDRRRLREAHAVIQKSTDAEGMKRFVDDLSRALGRGAAA